MVHVEMMKSVVESSVFALLSLSKLFQFYIEYDASFLFSKVALKIKGDKQIYGCLDCLYEECLVAFRTSSA